MKYVIIVPDGLGDYPIESLGHKTPLEAAHVPHLHELARRSILGTLRTTPESMYPGSDVCGLSLMGYDAKTCYTGRAPLEAANLGLTVRPGELAFRTNLISTEGEILSDYSADHITTEEATALIQTVQQKLGTHEYSFHPGKMYRHILIHKDASQFDVEATPPHDIQGQRYADYWPKGRGADLLRSLMEKSRPILEQHPVNQKRAAQGKKKANMIWFWGGGEPPHVENFQKKFGVKGGVISAVDLLMGLGRYVGWEIIHVPGATGYFDTDYAAKGRYAIDALKRMDLVYVHIEATDEAGHSGLADEKVKAIEQIDHHIVGPIVQALAHEKAWRLYVAPDHYTPVARKTHVADDVPFIFAGSDVTISSGKRYTEKDAASTGIKVDPGYLLMHRLIKGWENS